MSLEEFVTDFCECILNENRHDFLDVEVSNSEQAFFRKYDSVFKGKIKLAGWDSDILIQQYTYKNCNIYFKRASLLQNTPYDFYDSVSMRKHMECLRKFFSSKYRKVLPSQIEKICTFISLKGEEFQNIQTYFNEQIEVTSEYKSELLHSELDKLRANIKQSTKDTNGLIVQTTELVNKVQTANEEIKKVENRSAKKMTEASVTVLGIFSAVILTFNAALSFSASVLQNINSASIYRLLLVSLTIGLISFNLVFALFYYLNSFRNKLAAKKEENALKQQGCKSLLLFVITDIILVLFMAAIVVAWWNGAVETRNERINNNELRTESSVVVTDNVLDGDIPETTEE